MPNKIILSPRETVEAMIGVMREIKAYVALEHNHTVPYSAIVSIANGGVPFGLFLDTHLRLKNYNITIQCRDGSNNIKNTPTIRGMNKISKLKTPFLLVDDIVDSGTTLKHFQNKSGFKFGKDFHVASLFWCEENSPNLQPTFYHSKKYKKDWIVYPWERKITFDEWFELALIMKVVSDA